MSRRSWPVAGAAVAAVIAGAAGVAVGSSATRPARAAQRSQVSTAIVRRESLSATVAQSGTLTYAAQPDGSPYSVVNQAHGAYTQLPAIGQIIHQGQVLYRVNEIPVLLLYGSTPAYRTLRSGATGRDVQELNRDLVSLGYATPTQLNPTSDTFQSATTVALEKLQARVGLTQSGELALGQALFSQTALRVTAVEALLGEGAHPGESLLQATSTKRQVQVALDATQQSDMAVGDRVTITLPNNKTTPGIVTAVGSVATCGPGSGSRGPSPVSSAPGTDSCSSANATPTVNVDIAPVHPALTGTWDQAPVQVGITTSRARNVLVVPVTALLARSDGGYAVEVAGREGRNQLVTVSLGMFDDADGVVQVSGSGLTPGQRVVVPST